MIGKDTRRATHLMKLGGWVGDITYAGLVGPLLPLLQAAEVCMLAKGPVSGSGNLLCSMHSFLIETSCSLTMLECDFRLLAARHQICATVRICCWVISGFRGGAEQQKTHKEGIATYRRQQGYCLLEQQKTLIRRDCDSNFTHLFVSYSRTTEDLIKKDCDSRGGGRVRECPTKTEDLIKKGCATESARTSSALSLNNRRPHKEGIATCSFFITSPFKTEQQKTHKEGIADTSLFSYVCSVFGTTEDLIRRIATSTAVASPKATVETTEDLIKKGLRRS